MFKRINKLIFATILFVSFTSSSLIIVQAKEILYPKIIAQKAITMDMETKEIIYAQNIDDKAQPASTTKLMTGLLLAENKNKSDVFTYTELALEQPSSSIYVDHIPGIVLGDTITADNIMKGLLLHSGNDTACIIAEEVGGGIESFASMMNSKAKNLGMNNTKFYTPSGLDNDKTLNGNEHYTTAYDLSLLGMAAYNNEWVRETMALKDDIEIATRSGLKSLIKNGNRNLNVNGCIGGKTGYTLKAGRCLVAIYERDGRKLIGVVLGSTYPEFFSDMESIIDYSYDAEKTTLYSTNETIQTKPINFKPFKKFGEEKVYDMPIIIKDTVTQYSNEINNKETKIDIKINEINTWNLSNDVPIGKLTLSERNRTETYDLYTTLTTEDLVNDNKNLYKKFISIVITVFFLLSVLIFITIRLLIKKRKS